VHLIIRETIDPDSTPKNKPPKPLVITSFAAFENDEFFFKMSSFLNSSNCPKTNNRNNSCIIIKQRLAEMMVFNLSSVFDEDIRTAAATASVG